MVSVRLPSLSVVGNNSEPCFLQSQCPNGMFCTLNSTWAKQITKFYRHDEIPGSNQYVEIENPALNGGGFCICNGYGGWTGYDCTSFDASYYVEAMFIWFQILVCFITFILGMRNIVSLFHSLGRSMRNLYSSLNAVIICQIIIMLSGICNSLSGVFHFIDISRPQGPFIGNFKGPLFVTPFVWTNTVGVCFVFMALLQLVTCWISVYKRASSFTTSSYSESQYVKMIRFVSGAEISLFLLILILNLMRLFFLTFIASIPWLLLVLFMAVFAMVKFKALAKQRQENLASQQQQQNTGSKTNKTISSSTQEALLSIVRYSQLIVMIMFFGIASSIFLSLTLIRASFILSNEPGGFARLSAWGNVLVFSITIPSFTIVLQAYVQPRIHKQLDTLNKKRIKSDEEGESGMVTNARKDGTTSNDQASASVSDTMQMVSSSLANHHVFPVSNDLPPVS